MATSEAAPCLMRSVSQPLFAASREGDPLTTSISFGRFMTEPLDWEKWSSFSHNRTREDVQKYSRPGAVAEKKAFFEAYFNKFAAAKPPKKENKPPQTNVTLVTISNTRENQSPTVATDDINKNSRGVESEITSNQDVSSPSIITWNVDDVISSTCPTGSPFAAAAANLVLSKSGVISSNEDVCSPFTNFVSSETDDIISSTIHEKPSPNLVCSQYGNVEENVLSNTGEIADVCSSLVILEDMNVDDGSGQMEQEKTSKENVSLENHSCKVKISKQSSHVDKNKKRLIKDKVSGKITEISYVISSSRKPPIPEVHPKNQILKCNPRVSSVSMVKKSSQGLLRSENKRSKPLLDSSVNGNKTLVLKSHSRNSLSETLIASTKKTRSITVPSSFIFKSDERAAKRKQFFQKLEEKPKMKKEARCDDKKSRWSTVVSAKPSRSETKGPTNKIQKIMQGQQSRTLPRKLGMKPKNFIEINKKILSSSIAFLPSKKSHD